MIGNQKKKFYAPIRWRSPKLRTMLLDRCAFMVCSSHITKLNRNEAQVLSDLAVNLNKQQVWIADSGLSIGDVST